MPQPATTKTLGEIWGARIAQRREAAGMTQPLLAELCGVRQQTISKTETGETLPREGLKLALAAALGTTITDLFAYPDDIVLDQAS